MEKFIEVPGGVVGLDKLRMVLDTLLEVGDNIVDIGNGETLEVVARAGKYSHSAWYEFDGIMAPGRAIVFKNHHLIPLCVLPDGSPVYRGDTVYNIDGLSSVIVNGFDENEDGYRIVFDEMNLVPLEDATLTKPKKPRTVWINIYTVESGEVFTRSYLSKRDANEVWAEGGEGEEGDWEFIKTITTEI